MALRPMSKKHIKIPATIANGALIAGTGVPDDLEWDPENPLEVNSCIGHAIEHSSECDGECEKLTMDEFDIKIENERRAWARLGISTDGYKANQLRQDVQLQTIIQIIQDRFSISNEEFNVVFKPLMLEHMTVIRKATEPQIESQRTRSRIILPDKPLH